MKGGREHLVLCKLGRLNNTFICGSIQIMLQNMNTTGAALNTLLLRRESNESVRGFISVATRCTWKVELPLSQVDFQAYDQQLSSI